MTRRRFYASPENFTPGGSSFSLDDDESRHLREVLRLRSGDQVYVFDGEGREFLCEVETIERRGGAAVLKICAEVEAARPESKLELELALALLKGEKFDLVVQKATELGVTRITPVITKRADVRLREERDATKRAARLRRLALEAAKQSGRARIPEIEQPILFAEMVDRRPDDGLTVLFAERNGDNLGKWKLAAGAGQTKLTALVGPEGGWEDAEIAHARASGCQVVTLGGRILRAETAAIAVVVLLQNIFGDLN